ncbi:hypothetical protein D3C71_1812830 [compost metagenome]
MQVGKHRLLHELRVQGRYAVNRMRADKGELPHADPSAAMLVDQRDRGDLLVREPLLRPGLGQDIGIDLVDDLHMARQ